MKKMRLPKPVATRVVHNRLTLGSVYTAEQMRKFAEKAVLLEREECAVMVDHILKEGGGTYGDAIRVRGDT